MHSISKKLKSGGGGATLKLASPPDAVSRVLKTLGFDQVFDVYRTLDEALKSY